MVTKTGHRKLQRTREGSVFSSHHPAHRRRRSCLCLLAMVAVIVIVAGAGDDDGAQAVWLAMVAIRRGLWLSEHWPEWQCASAMSPRACLCHDLDCIGKLVG
jgi:hypothetical protein